MQGTELLVSILKAADLQLLRKALPRASHQDWNGLLSVASASRISPYVYTRLRGLWDVIPVAVKNQLTADYRRNGCRNLLVQKQLFQIVKPFQEAGIPLLALKGVHLIGEIYRDPSARYVGDVDVMVPRSCLQQASDLMNTLRFNSTSSIPVEAEATISHHLKPFVNGSGIRVEVHWNLSRPADNYRVNPSEFWNRIRTVEKGPLRFHGLGLGDLLFHLCIHTSQHHQFDIGLRASCDIAELLETSRDQIDFDAFLDLVSRAGAKTGTFLALSLAQELAGARIPERILTRLAPEGSSDRLLNAARSLVFAEKANLRSISRNLAGFWDAPSYSSRLRALGSRIFIPRLVLARAYGIPPTSRWIYLYYPVRIFDLMRLWGGSALQLMRRDKTSSEIAEYRALISKWLSPR